MQPIDRPTSTRPGTLADTDVALYLGFVEELARADAGGIVARFLSPGFVEHVAGDDCTASETAERLVARRARFPDAEWTIELLAGIGGLVVCHSTMTCAGDASGRARGHEIVVARISEGRIAESWRVSDDELRTD